MNENLIILSPFILILCTYLIYFIFRKRIILSSAIVKVIFLGHYFTLAICFLLFILNELGISFSSLWGNKIFAWLLLISMCSLVLSRRFIVNQFEKGYVNVMFYAPIALIVPWLIPMLGAFICYSFAIFFTTEDSSIAFNDENFMLKFDEGFLVYDHEPTLYKKYGVFMREVKEFELPDWNFEIPISIKEVSERTIEVSYLNDKNTPFSIIVVQN